MFFEYNDKKVDIMFRRKNKKSDYIVEHIGFSIGTPIYFGGDIIISKSKKADIVNKFGNGINDPVADLCYKIKGKDVYYTFLTDDKGILVRVLICSTRNCL